MNAEEILDRILELAREADGDLTSEGLIDAEPLVFKQARQEFGSWDNALVQALVKALQGSRRKRLTSKQVVAAEEHQRQRVDGWDGPVMMAAADGALFSMGADAWEVSADAESGLEDFDPREEGDALGLVSALSNPEEGVVMLLSDSGVLYPVDARVVPHPRGARRTGADVTGMASAERVAAMMLRQELRRARRFIHVTRQGRIKASSARDFGNLQDRDGTVALLLADDDRILTAFPQGEGQGHVFCANASGNAIHFDANEVRTMGLRAQGVKAMELVEGDELVGAAAVREGDVALVISAAGDGKRVPIDQFRVQGRAGQGMILMRPHRPGDLVAAMIILDSPDDDVLVWSAQGRARRIPATAFPLLDRASRGQAVVSLPDGDQVAGMCRLPGAG